jgi:hypothetical protein
MLTLTLTRLPADPFAHRGCYPSPSGTNLPERARYLHPDAARSLVAIEEEHPATFFYSDVLRSAMSSLDAVRRGRGAQPPAFSAHNYGVAVDVDLGETLKRGRTRGLMSYAALLRYLEGRGWYCHRRDGRDGKEAWHMNYLGTGDVSRYFEGVDMRHRTWDDVAERRILEVAAAGGGLELDAVGVQTCLRKLGLYPGELDGDIGPLSREGVRAFQRAYGVKEDGKTTPRTQRVLAFVAAEVVLVPLAA